MNQIEIRLPQMQGNDPNVAVLQGYLYQLSEQLNFALNEISIRMEAEEKEAEKTADRIEEQTAPGTTFSKIKSLIIKSADIVNSYSDQISAKLEGIFVAQSDFGEFREQTAAQIEANSTEITQIYTNIQEVTASIGGVDDRLQQVTAYIRTGQLYEDDDGQPVYGVEIGQQTQQGGAEGFQRFVRLVANRLSFYDQNGIEVAYISSEILHIYRAEIEELEGNRAAFGSLQLGDYTITAGADGHMTIT